MINWKLEIKSRWMKNCLSVLVVFRNLLNRENEDDVYEMFSCEF